MQFANHVLRKTTLTVEEEDKIADNLIYLRK